jgi:hypothetical protein
MKRFLNHDLTICTACVLAVCVPVGIYIHAVYSYYDLLARVTLGQPLFP